MKKSLQYCDICNIERQSLFKHWSMDIKPLTLVFKDMPSIQSNIVINDCCSNCAKNLFDKIIENIKELKDLSKEIKS